MTEDAKQVTDVAAGGVTISAFMAWIPEATALLSLVWVCIRIYETDTVKNIIRKSDDG
tara:strand:+ start:2979 stop:3152 length:174 start_codon:yes stop_codon:yes gene_type:complete